LDTSANIFTEVPTSAFEGLARLKVMTISRCPNLRQTRLNAFSGLFALNTLTMSGNPQLSELHPGSFEQERQRTLEIVLLDDESSLAATVSRTGSGKGLQKLYLNGNDLKTLPGSLVHYATLVELDLSENPWNCDCNLRYLGELTSKIVYIMSFLKQYFRV